MECKIKLVRCDSKTLRPSITMWDIAFEVEAEEYPTQYVPTTVYSYELVVNNETSAVQLAASRCIPQQIAVLFEMQRNKEVETEDEIEVEKKK